VVKNKEERRKLEEITAPRPGAEDEYARFLGIRNRELWLPREELRAKLGGKKVLVTGGTGCIGSALMSELAGLGASGPRLLSVSRGQAPGGWHQVENATYWYRVDVRDAVSTHDAISGFRPDVIFHCAAQRSPALAECEVRRTVETNLLGLWNVLCSAEKAGVPQVVVASTGKALRPYSPEVYTASKRAAEWLAAAEAEDEQMLVSAARFTHVVDNSIVHARLLDEARRRGGVIRLHSADISFYVQSALESAQLLLAAFLGAKRGELRVHAITDLEWPVSLTDVAFGVLAAEKSHAPVRVVGYDPGYEETPFPGLYDPRTAGDVSPLLNSFEAERLADATSPQVDSFQLQIPWTSTAGKAFTTLKETCDMRNSSDCEIRAALDRLSWVLLDSTLSAADQAALARSARQALRHSEFLTPAHQRIVGAICGNVQLEAAV
jgi:nucleoside-diphosphate-sugar epimerase